MGTAEDGVVDFLAHAVENGHVAVGVLRRAVALYGLTAPGAQGRQTAQEVGLDNVVGIEDDHGVEVAAPGLCHRILQGASLGTMLEQGPVEGDGQ